MKRKITAELEAWAADPGRNSLIVTGCRQCGKTFSVSEFAERYSVVIFINFETNPEKRAYFEGSLDPDDLLPAIALYEGRDLVPGSSLLVMDEIQACPKAYSQLKPLSRNGICDVIAMGSFLGINLEDSDDVLSPLGYVNVIHMHPMDFEEFLWAMGVPERLTGAVGERIRSLTPLEIPMLNILSDHFRRYLIVGGMPKAVLTYSESRSYPKTMGILKDIVQILLRDAGKYSRKAGRQKINACFQSIPRQIARENKRFSYTDVEKIKGQGKRTYGNSLDWLINAGIAIRCYNLEEPVSPLSESVKEGDFKIYLQDTGILAALMDSFDPADIVLKDTYSNHGAFMECAIAGALQKKGYPLYFYAKSNSTLEVDFVMRDGADVVLLEVKSGKNTRSRSLTILMSEKNRKRVGIKVMESNVEEANGIVKMPLFAPCFFRDAAAPDIPPVEPLPPDML